MDGSFACPECGSSVEVGGLAPGRQVRCGFCHRLLEVPYLPRVPGPGWKRRRSRRWKWVRWAWCGVAVVVAVAVIQSGIRLLRHQYRSVQESTISQRLASSRAHEAEGRLDQALVDLDAALDLIRRMGESAGSRFEQEQEHRPDLARREVQAALDRIVQGRHDHYPLGEWLTLIDRSRKDQDLATVRPRIEGEFHRSVRSQGTVELDAARRDFESGRVVTSMTACDKIAALLPYLPAEARVQDRRAAEDLANRLVATHGVVLETPRGEFVLGSYNSYRARLVPIVTKALEAKGFLPYRDTSAWKAAWQKASYRLRLEISERQEGDYLSTENRLTRIEAHLTLASAGRVVWETRPTARTVVPLPGLPAYLSGRLAASPARSEEFERLLYENARGQIERQVGQALGHMPACCP